MTTTAPPAPDTIAPELAAALVAACADLDDIGRGHIADAGQYSYRYADLAAVLAVVRPVFAGHGLAVVQAVETEPVDKAVHVTITTIIVHTSGATFASPPLRLVAPPDPQRVGSVVTYARRYSLMSTVGVAARGEDDDAANTTIAAAPAPPPRTEPAAPRTQAESAIRRMLDAVEPEMRRQVVEAFRAHYGCGLAGLDPSRHDEALSWVTNEIEVALGDADDRASADAAHLAAEQPNPVTPAGHTQP